jgi:hypothetical protein
MEQENSITVLEKIARKHLSIPTLETRKMDSLDFYDVSVWGVKAALMEAYNIDRISDSTDLRSLFKYRDELNQKIKDYFNWDGVGLESISDYTDVYWVECDDCIFCDDKVEDFDNPIIIPLLSKCFTKKNEFITVTTCMLYQDQKQDNIEVNHLIGYPSCVETIILDKNKKIDKDTTDLRKKYNIALKYEK